MQIKRARRHGSVIATAVVMGLIVFVSTEALAEEFRESLTRIDQALKANPNHVSRLALVACRDRRQRAAELFNSRQTERAQRSLKFCFNLLGIPAEIAQQKPTPPETEEQRAAAAEALRARAARDFDRAVTLNANVERGLEIYRGCAACHTPEGWGMRSGIVPQLAGQHRRVVIKQLADIRAGNRENGAMAPYSSVEAIGGAQAVADVAGYIDTLEISVENGKGPGDDLALGEELYRKNCKHCHGERGEGSNDEQIPRIQAQHYDYLVNQFELIRNGGRRNADPEMMEQIQRFERREIRAIMDFVARLEPPEALQAPPDWRNPDFAQPIVGR
ncbi:MAG: cytochrome C [Deltaproteobacteria bacterium]|jgi:cytochrome c553|nr:cytochrome C [Deltaproteobacteria bacterium]